MLPLVTAAFPILPLLIVPEKRTIAAVKGHDRRYRFNSCRIFAYSWLTN
jgi:hypothetical protein